MPRDVFPRNVFPFELDGVTVLGEGTIEHDGRVWQAGVGPIVGQWAMRPNWLRQGAVVDGPSEGELWLSDGERLEPSVGPAWEGVAYVPTPEYVREQVVRRRAGLPPRERRRLRIEPNPGRGPI
jgi:hypothetical protein